MAELADAPDLGSGVPDVQVQVLSAAVGKTRKAFLFRHSGLSDFETIFSSLQRGYDRMDVAAFQEALENLCSRAAAEHGIVTSGEVREAFSGMELSEDQLLRVLAYLKAKGITIADIEIRDPDAETVPEEEKTEEKAVGTPRKLSAAEEEYLKDFAASFGGTVPERPEGSFREKQAFVNYYLPKAAGIAASMNCEEISFSDLLQEACLALMDAAEELAEFSVEEEVVEKRIRQGIREAITRQLDQNDQDSQLIGKVQSLDEKIRELAEEDDGTVHFTMDELSVILDMSADEIRAVMKLIGDQ